MNYEEVISFFKNNQIIDGERFWDLIELFPDTYIARITKDCLIVLDTLCFSIATPCLNSYQVQTDVLIYYHDIANIQVNKLVRAISLKLYSGEKGKYNTIDLCHPWKRTDGWGIDVKSLNYYL